MDPSIEQSALRETRPTLLLIPHSVCARGWGPRDEASPNCQFVVGEWPKLRIAFGPLARGPRERAMGPLRRVPALESWQTPGRSTHYNPTSLRVSSEAHVRCPPALPRSQAKR